VTFTAASNKYTYILLASFWFCLIIIGEMVELFASWFVFSLLRAEAEVVLRMRLSPILCEDGMVFKLATDGVRDKYPSSSLLELSAAEPPIMTEDEVVTPPVEVVIGTLVPDVLEAAAFALLPVDTRYGVSGFKRPWRTTSSRLQFRASPTRHSRLE
jgi:hypothetical protein